MKSKKSIQNTYVHLQTASIAHHAGGQMQMGWQYHYFPNDPTRRQRRTDLDKSRGK